MMVTTRTQLPFKVFAAAPRLAAQTVQYIGPHQLSRARGRKGQERAGKKAGLRAFGPNCRFPVNRQFVIYGRADLPIWVPVPLRLPGSQQDKSLAGLSG